MMSALENESDSVEVEDLEDVDDTDDEDDGDENDGAVALLVRTRKPARTRTGGSNVISDELLDGLVESFEDLPVGEEIVIGIPRNTKGSAAGFGYQIKVRLERDRSDELNELGVRGVHSAARASEDTPVIVNSNNSGVDVPDPKQGPWFAAISVSK